MSQAQELRIGYVSGERVLRDSHPAKAAQAKLEAEFAKREKDLAEVAARLKATSEKLEKDAPDACRRPNAAAASATWSNRTASSSASAASSRKT